MTATVSHVPAGGVARPPARLFLAVCAAAVAAVVVTTLLVARIDADERPVVRGALFVWIIATYTGAGLIAWWRRPESRFGPLMIAAGFASFATSLAFSPNEVLFTIGMLFDLVPAAATMHVLLAFPTGRLAGRTDRALVLSAYVVAVVPQVVRMMLGEVPNLLAVTTAPDAAAWVFKVQASAMVVLLLSGVALLLVRRRAEGHALRRQLALLVYAFSLSLVMIAFLLTVAVLGHQGFETTRRLTLFTLGLAPLAFLVGLLEARLSRSSIGDLMIELRTHPAPPDLRNALARALRDPSLSLVYWLPEFETWADLDGQPVTLPTQRGRTATVIDHDGSPVAALVHDPALDEEPELLEAVGAAASLALENAQLYAERSAHLDELQRSRARIVEAGQSERKRLERNLHDGAQQRLVALSLELSLLERRVGSGDPEVAARLDHARKEIGVSLEELRDVARGLHPSMLTSQGLEIALKSMAARSPVPVELVIDLTGRLPEPVEVAAYYVVSESLANVGKHAQATKVRVTLRPSQRGLLVQVDDDGIGGADLHGGSGLRGLSDRVAALGGRLEVGPNPRGGTRVGAQLPYES
jgi:signal transduction histidine kinase